MASLTPHYSANRSVREYVERCYLPAAAAYRERSENGGALALQMSVWRRAIDLGWRTLRFGDAAVETRGDRHHFTVEVGLGVLDPQSVRVELYADPQGDVPAVVEPMTRLVRSEGAGLDVYAASVAAARSAGDYTARIVPFHLGVNVPLEAPFILWQR
jgi:starch phosphorylase